MLLADPMPINRQLWTTSYAFLMAGLASICFAPRIGLGMNGIAAFIGSQALVNVPRVHFFGRWLYEDVCRQLLNPPNASLLYALIYLGGVCVVVWVLRRQRWWLKI
jgi:predicted acyltransferase